MEITRETVAGVAEERKFGWKLSEEIVLKFPNPRKKVNYAGKRGVFDFSGDWSLPSGWDFAQRKIADDTYAYETPARASYDADSSVFTGKIGTITGFNIISDRFIEPVVRKSKYVYALTKGRDNKGRHIVQVYLWERDNPDKTYWYKFRSARLAHAHMKKYDTAKRGWKDHE